MPKVSFRMASACRESVFGVQTNTARNCRSDHTESRLNHRAKRMLRTEGNHGRFVLVGPTAAEAEADVPRRCQMRDSRSDSGSSNRTPEIVGGCPIVPG